MGYDVDRAATQDRIFWVNASSVAEVEAAIDGTGAIFHTTIVGGSNRYVDFHLPADKQRLRERLEVFNRKPPESDRHNFPDREFKNFHRLLCERFNYSHDDIDWKRDQVSLIEWIAKCQEVAERQRDDLLKAVTLIAGQSVGEDWTVEDAFAFVRQHARAVRDAVRVEMSGG